MENKTFLVERSTWGTGRDGKKLLTMEGNMCCLGFVCHQAGVRKSKLKDMDFPENLIGDLDAVSFLLKEVKGNLVNRKWVERAAQINDDTDIEDDEREKKLISIFKKNGYTLTFVD